MQNTKRETTTRMAKSTAPATPEENGGNELPLSSNNFIMMGISLVLIIAGFALMGGSPSGLDEFNPDIFSTRRIVVGPCICFLGFVLMAIAIIVKPKDKKQ